MSKVSKRPSVVMPTLVEDRAINAATKADPDARPLAPAQLAALVPLRSLRGRPTSANAKPLVSVRYSPEVPNTSNPLVRAGSPAWMASARVRHTPFAAGGLRDDQGQAC
jgi:hypothetical protein